MANLSFDAATVAPQQSFDVLPAGVYAVVAIESDVVPTKAGDGEIAKFTFQVLEGEFSGRRLWGRFNVKNKSAEAERIGRAQLSSFCHAAGVIQLTDTSQLQDVPVRVKVKVRPASGSYGESNDIVGFEPYARGSAAPAPTRPAAPAAAVTPPWKAKA